MTMTPAREVFTLGHVVVVDGSNTCFCSRRSRRVPHGTPGVRDERHPGYSLCWRRRQRHSVLVPPERQNLAAHQCKHWWVQVWANQSNQHLARPPLPPCPTTAAMVRAAGVGPQRRAQRAVPSSLLEVVSHLPVRPQRAAPPAPWAAWPAARARDDASATRRASAPHSPRSAELPHLCWPGPPGPAAQPPELLPRPPPTTTGPVGTCLTLA